MPNPQDTRNITDPSLVNSNPANDDIIVSANKISGKTQTMRVDLFAKTADLANKPNKSASPTANNIKTMDAQGNDLNSGKTIADLEPAIVKNTAFNKNYSTNLSDLKQNGNASLGTNDTLVRSDHVHPSDATKADLSYVNTQLNTKANTSDVNTALNTKIDKTSIENTLTSTDTTKVLSAAQGKILNDNKANTSDVNTALNLKLDKTSVINNLTSTSITDALSAAQGKVLQDAKLDKTSVKDTLISTSTTDALATSAGKQLKDLIDTKANSADIATLAQNAVINNGVASATQTYSSSVIEERLSNLPQGGGSGISYYVSNVSSDVATYKVLDTSPISATGTLTATANNNQVLLQSFATAILNRTLLNSGFWEFNFACSIDSNPTASKVSNLVVELYTRDGATETLLNSITTEAITSTNKIEINAILAQQQITITATTRIVIKIFAKTTETKNVLFTLFYGGTDSHVHTPFKLTKADIGLSQVQDVDTTKASNIAIDGVFLSNNAAITTGDSLKTASQKAQGQIEALQSGKQNTLTLVDTARIDLTLSGSNLSADIIAGSIGTTQLADNGVTTAKIIDNAITNSKVASGIDTSKITQATYSDNTNQLNNGDNLDVALNKIQYQAKDALHKNTTNEINNLTAKTSVIDTDVILAENSANVFSKIKITFANIWNYIKSKDSNVKNWYVHNTNGNDSNNGYSPNNAFLTLDKATTSLGNTGEALNWLLGQFSTSVTFNQLNVDIKGDNANKGAATGTSGTVTSSNPSAAQRYSNLVFGAFTKTGAGQAYLENVNITGTLNDTSAGYLKYKNGSIGSLSITGTGIKVFEDFELNGTVAINNSLVSVSFNGVGRAITLSTANAISLTAGTLSIRNMIIYCPANTVFGASGVNFLFDNVQFINPATGFAQVITIPAGVNYSLQNCEYDPTSSINGTDISSTRIKRFGNIFAKIIEITSATIDTLIIKGKTFSLNNITNPTNASADGSGIIVKGATDKTFAYNNTLQSFQSSENISIPSGKDFYIGNTKYADTTKTLTQTTFTLDGTSGNVLNGIKNANIAADAAIDASKMGDGTVSNTEFSYIGTLVSDAQTQLNGKQPASSTLTTLAGTLNPETLTKFGAIPLTSADSGKIPQVDANGNIVLNAPTSGGNVSVTGLTNASGKAPVFNNANGTSLALLDTTIALNKLNYNKSTGSIPVLSTTERNNLVAGGQLVNGDTIVNSTTGTIQTLRSGTWYEGLRDTTEYVKFISSGINGGGTLLGNASWSSTLGSGKSTGVVLTTNNNNQKGIWYKNIANTPKRMICTTSFTIGSGSGADGMWYSFFASSIPTTSNNLNTANNSYTIYFNEYNLSSTLGVSLYYNGTQLTYQRFPSFDYGGIDHIKNAEIKLYYDPITDFTRIVVRCVGNYGGSGLAIDYEDNVSRNLTGTYCIVGASTGGVNNYHILKDISISNLYE